MGWVRSNLTTSLHCLTDGARDSRAVWRKIERIEEEQRIYDAKQSEWRVRQRASRYESEDA